MEPDLRIEVTNADIRVAKSAWLVALDTEATPERVEQLHRGYETLIRAQAQQMAEEFRARIR